MQLSQLEAFVVIAETGSLAKASKIIYATPAALSQRIKQLELSLGFSVFIRTKKGMALSENGRRIYDQAKSILDEVKSLNFNPGSQYEDGTSITIAVSSVFRNKMINDLLYSVCESGIHCNIRYVSDDLILSLFKTENLDAALTFDVSDARLDFETKHLGNIKFSFISTIDNPPERWSSGVKFVTPYVRPLIDSYLIPMISCLVGKTGKYICIDCNDTAVEYALNNGYACLMDTNSAQKYIEKDSMLTLHNTEIYLPCYLIYKKTNPINKIFYDASIKQAVRNIDDRVADCTC